MPFVRPDQALEHPFLDLDAIAAEMGPPPWRSVLVGTGGMRVVLLRWPPGYAAIEHHHPRAEEIFLGDEPAQDVGPGRLMFAPRGVRHAIRVSGREPLTLLASVAPNEDAPDETVE
jgi:mannose-6-phosphate isomerase-like protein (cupin superfamily)